MNISVKGSGVELTEALSAYAAEKISSLEKYHADLMTAQVDLERTTHHQHKGDVWRAQGTLTAPKKSFHASHDAEDLYAAIDGLKDALKRELQSDKERMQDAARSVVEL